MKRTQIIKAVIFFFFFVLSIQFSNPSNAQANDIYMGEYSNGQIAYLDTSSIRTQNHYSQGYHEGDTYSCLVKAVWPNTDQYEVISYDFYIGQNISVKKNGQQIYHERKSDPRFWDNNPVEKNLCSYFERKHKQEWNKVPKTIR